MNALLSNLSRTLTLLALFAIISVTMPPAMAHNPIFGQDNHDLSTAVRIPDANISYAMYGYLDAPGEAQFYYMDISSPVSLMTQMNVPKNDVYANFRPSYAIIGPGITTHDPIPFEVPAGNGSLLINASRQEPRSEFYEPFSGITYNNSAKTYTDITVPGRYYIAIFDGSHKKGDYFLATGELESFSIWDLPSVIWKVIQLRLGWLDHSKEAAST
ncbi:hypothetical protein [Methanocella paludicola]|nr:hypothetical protein [Methanocella paludicola]